MSTADTGAVQRARLAELGLQPGDPPAAARRRHLRRRAGGRRLAPEGRFAAALRTYSAADPANSPAVTSSQRAK